MQPYTIGMPFDQVAGRTSKQVLDALARLGAEDAQLVLLERVTTDTSERVSVLRAKLLPVCIPPQCTIQIVSRRRLQQEASGTTFYVTRTFNASDNATLTTSTLTDTSNFRMASVLSVQATARMPATTTTDHLADELQVTDLTVSVATNDDDDDTNRPLLFSLGALPMVLAGVVLYLTRGQTTTTPLVTEIPLQPVPPTPYTR